MSLRCYWALLLLAAPQAAAQELSEGCHAAGGGSAECSVAGGNLIQRAKWQSAATEEADYDDAFDKSGEPNPGSETDGASDDELDAMEERMRGGGTESDDDELDGAGEPVPGDRASLLELGMTAGTMRATTTDEKDEFMHLHNMYRCMHGAAPLTWSDAMASNAQNYVEGGGFSGGHSDSYDLQPPLGPAGENLAFGSRTIKVGDAVDMWYNEVRKCHTGGPTNFTDGCKVGKENTSPWGTNPCPTGHFTAMVWAGATEMGCSVSTWGSSHGVIICQYRGGDTLSADTPNMEDQYTEQVLVQSKQPDECGYWTGEGGGVDLPTDGGIQARYVRIIPQIWHGSITMRAAVLTGVNQELQNVAENERTYSSVLAVNGVPGYPGSHKGVSKIRQGARRAWTAQHKQLGEWLQIDLGEVMDVRGVIIEGQPRYGCPNNSPHFVSAIKVQTATGENPSALRDVDDGQMYNTAEAFASNEAKIIFGVTGQATTTTTTVNCATAVESITGQGSTYRGCQTLTKTGLVCQEWASQSPQQHHLSPFLFPHSGLGSNYCRNPEGEETIWCYTTSTKRWEFCDPVGQTTTTTTINCPRADAEEVIGSGASYRGCQTETVSGRLCQAWGVTSPHGNNRNAINFPNSGLESNYCRNPDGEPKIWCYTMDTAKRWEFCNPVAPAQAGEQEATCVDTPEFENGYGYSCAVYAQRWCTNGAANSGFEWTLGAGFRNPEQNCCVCGKSGEQAGAQEATCVDTPEFENGHGYSCADYAQRWCTNGAANSGFEWTLGAGFRNPEQNCCVCGKSG